MEKPGEKSRDWLSVFGWLLFIVVVIVGAYYVGPYLLAGLPSPVNLVVYAFSTQEEVFTQGIFPAFEQEWAEKEDGELTIDSVFGPSGTMAGQINLGAPADMVLFSNQNHIEWLKVGKKVDEKSEPVLITSTPLVIVTRVGDPLGLASYSDLAQPGIQLLHANPINSGVGEWAILAEYGSEFILSGDSSKAETQLKEIWGNVRLLSPSARTAMTLFELGAGDALITYQQDALLAQARGIPLEVILPDYTILACHYAVIVDDNVTVKERRAAEKLLDFMLSESGQSIFENYHFQRIGSNVRTSGNTGSIFTEEELGGWSHAYETLIENLWKKEIQPVLELESATALIEIGE